MLRVSRWSSVGALVLAAAVLASSCAPTDVGAEAGDAPPDQTTAVPAPSLPEIPRFTVLGDSTAYMSSWGMLTALRRQGRADFVDGFTGLGCAVVRTPERRMADETVAMDPTCNDWARVWSGQLRSGRPDVVVVQTGSWDVADRQMPGDPTWRGPGDPVYDAFARSELLAAVDLLAGSGAVVVWLTSPEPGAAAYESSARVRAFDPAPRHRRFNQLVTELPTLRPGAVTVVDLAAWIAGQGPDEDRALRPDGVHFTHDSSAVVCERFLCDAVLAAARGLRPGTPGPTPDGSRPPVAATAGPAAPDARAAARTALVGRTLNEAGLAASAAGWRVRVDDDVVFDETPTADDELVLWYSTGGIVDVR